MALLKETNETVYKMIGSCMEVHRILGPGLPVEMYKQALEVEMTEKELTIEKDKTILVKYKEKEVGSLDIDFMVNEQVILAVRSQDDLKDVEIQQVLRAMTLSETPIGLLMNFGNMKIQYKRVLPSRQNREPKRNEVFRPIGYREMGKTREGNPLR